MGYKSAKQGNRLHEFRPIALFHDGNGTGQVDYMLNSIPRHQYTYIIAPLNLNLGTGLIER